MAAYDVIVVGAGSAGAAPRSRTVGGSDHLGPVARSRAGARHGGRARGASLDELLQGGHGAGAHLAGPRRDPRAAGQPEALYVRGRGAGGSSSVNAMGAIRGTVDDYERWAGELGCRGWGWPEMLDAFLRVEDDLDYGGDGCHGEGGPIPLSRVPFDRAVAARSCALRDGDAPTSATRRATTTTRRTPPASAASRSTVRDGRRVSTNDAYLEPARGRGEPRRARRRARRPGAARRPARGRRADGGGRGDRGDAR